jgi:hypothetical protein
MGIREGGKLAIMAGAGPMGLGALTDLRSRGAEDARYIALADIVDANRGLWCPEAEEYLLTHFTQE